MHLQRGSGILLHPTSLPGPWGIGDLGPAAYRFVDFLAAAGQRWWHILPLGPTSYGNSPYTCFSAWAGNPLLISPDKLVQDGLLSAAHLRQRPIVSDECVDYKRVLKWKRGLLGVSYELFKSDAPREHREGLMAFREQHAGWLEDFALFMALKEAHSGKAWTEWGDDLPRRVPQALQDKSRLLRDSIDFHRYVQYVFFHQWASLREYCHRKGVGIIGDVPIYLAHDSAEVWAHRDLFYMDEHGHPTVVGGVPPDYFSANGQRWGNPIYRWELHASSGFQWWIDRIRANLALFDLVRLDHFRGFEAYWEIPAAEPTAANGRWVKGPGASLFQAIKAALGDMPAIAEDLGVITPEVEVLRDQMELPGMRILQIAFGRDPKLAYYRPHTYPRQCVVYTATHDLNTTAGWFTAEPGKETTQSREDVELERSFALKYLGTDGREIHWDMIRLAMSSVAELAIFPLQDVLGLGSEARMNRPGTDQGNWEWRFLPMSLTDKHAERLRDLAGLYGRVPEGQ